MPFTLRQLELFTALPEFTTLSAAASHLRISESALSHALTELEKAVGEPLLVRRKARGYVLTPAGQYFADRARELLKGAAELRDALSSREGELSGPISVGCFLGLAPTVLPPLFDGFTKDHPKTSLQITLGTQDELLGDLEERRVDIAFLYDTDLPPGLNQQTLYETELMVILPEGHRLVDQESISLEEIVGDPMILLDSTPSTAHIRKVFREHNLTPDVFAALPTIELVRALVGRGLGYSLLMSRPYGSAMTEDGRRVISRPLNPRSRATTTVAAWPEGSPLSARASAAVAYAAAELA